jgi:predicted metal-dependent hydrolase
VTTQPADRHQHEQKYPPEYLRGIELFNAGEYYECHEVLEDIWVISCGQEKLFYQGIIMAAVALYDYEVGRFGAARTMHRKAKERLEPLPDQFMSLDIKRFINQLDEFFAFTVEAARAGHHQPTTRPKIQLATESG